MSLYKRGCTLLINKVASIVDIAKDVPEINSTAEHIIANKDDSFVYAWTRAVTADINNLNGDIFTLDELKKAYPTFIGRNLHLDHDTSSVAKAVGKVFDAKLLKDPFAKEGEGDWYVGCLIGVDATAHPDIAQKVKSGVIDSVSMGASVEQAECLWPYAKIFTPDGLVRIADLEVGDYVLTHKGRFKKVTATIKKPAPTEMFRISFADGCNQGRLENKRGRNPGNFLDLSANHPILLEDGSWVKASDIKVGDRVVCLVKRCLQCGKPILYSYNRNFCSKSCKSKYILSQDGAIEGRIRKSEDTRSRYTPEQRAYLHDVLSNSQKRYYSSLTDEQKVEHSKKSGDGIRRFFASDKSLKERKRKAEFTKKLWENPKYAEKFTEVLNNITRNLASKKHSIIEDLFDKELTKRGYSGYKTNHYMFIDGMRMYPDFVFEDKGIIVECDGEYWHNLPGVHEKDIKKTEILERNGFTVLRFTGSAIIKDVVSCVDTFERVYNNHSGNYEFYPFEVIDVEAIKTTKKCNNVYNISVEDDESYIAENLVVHNCGICHKVCSTPEQFCSHLQNLGRVDPETGKLCTSINHGVTFTELSLVGVPADPMAKMQQVFAGFVSSNINKKADLNEDTKVSLTEKFSFSIPCGNEKICEMLYNELNHYSNQGIKDLHIEGSVLTVSVEALNQDLALRKLKKISDEQGLVVKEPLKEETLESDALNLSDNKDNEEILMSTKDSLKATAASEEIKPLRLDFKGSKEEAEGLAKKFNLKLNDYHKDEDGKTKVTFEGTKENLEKLHNEGFFDAPENEKEFMKFHEEPETKKEEEDKKEAGCSSEEKVEKEAEVEEESVSNDVIERYKEKGYVEKGTSDYEDLYNAGYTLKKRYLDESDNGYYAVELEKAASFKEEIKEEIKEKEAEVSGGVISEAEEAKQASAPIENVLKSEDAVVTKETLNAPNSTETDAVIAESLPTDIETEAAPEKVEEEKLKVEKQDGKEEVKKDFKEEVKGPQEEKKEDTKEDKKVEDKKVDESAIKEAIKMLEDMAKQESAEKEPEEADKLRQIADILKGKKEEVKEEKKVEEVKKEDGKEEKVKDEVKVEEKPLPKESSEVVNNDIPTFASVDRIALFKTANLLGSRWLFQLKGSAKPVIVAVKDLIDTKLDEKLAYFTSEDFKNDLMKGISSKADFSKDTVMEVVAGFNEKIKVKPDEAASHVEHSNVKVKDETDKFVNLGGKSAPEAEVSLKATDDGKKQTEEKVNKKEDKSAVTYSTKKAPSETDLKMVASLKSKIASLQSELADSKNKYESLQMSNLLAKKEAKCREIVKASMDRGLVQLNESFRKEAFEKCASPTEAKEIAWRKTADAMVHDLLALDDSDLDAKLQALSHFKVQAEVKEVVKPFNVQASLNDDSVLDKTIQALVGEMD